jgi:signal transduction histidine kinase
LQQAPLLHFVAQPLPLGRVILNASLQAAADTIANALSAEPQRVFGVAEEGPEFDRAQGDLHVFPAQPTAARRLSRGLESCRRAHEHANACFMHGAPELILQMLDKLIENAVDFCSASGTITVRLTRAATDYELAVSNDGPPIPPDMLSRLFESLFEHRLGVDDKPHFGLGLYIVRLIAEFHGGRAIAANRSTDAGAVFTVILPLI